MKAYHVEWRTTPPPEKDCPAKPVFLSDETMRERLQKVLARMKKANLDQLVIYGDVEHGSNFEYLVGFFPRFEEALLVLNRDGSAALALGNENLNKADKSRLAARAVHIPLFSLPNQPCFTNRTMRDFLLEAGVQPGAHVGVIGWKLFTTPAENAEQLFDLPAFLIDALREAVGSQGTLQNATRLMIGQDGARVTNNANELAHYEWGAALASDCILDAMDRIAPGVPELELGDALVRRGQHTSIVTIAASGPRYLKGNMFPTGHCVRVGEPVSLTVGYRGGSSSRCAVAAADASQLPDGQNDYLERVAAPYFAAYAAWLEQIRIGMTGGEIFRLIDEILPRQHYGWKLCPGHLTAEEEWMASPIYEGSEEVLRSGMLFQVDIIPSVPGYPGSCAESTVALAGPELRRELQASYPALWNRIQKRRRYLRNALHIHLSDEVLPMCSTVGYLRPYLLSKSKALVLAGAR